MSKSYVRALARPLAVSALALLVAALAACSSSQPPAAAPNAAGKPAAVHAPVAPAHAATTAPVANAASKLAAMSPQQLMAAAQKALQDNRLVAPAGDNAFDYYLEILKRDPHDRAAKDALRETFPYGAQSADQSINQGDFPEAQREIDLLARADPTNYTLTILRSKLDAARKLASQKKQAQQQAQVARAQSAVSQAEQTRLAAAAATLKQQQEQAAQAAAQKQAEQAAALKQAQAAAAAAEKQREAQAAAASAAQNREAQIIRQVPPQFPIAAARDGVSGWVDIAFTVNADGSVSNVHVTDAQPRRVFDRAAIEAVSKWKFKPALINGVPTAVVLQRRIDFTLPGG